MLALPRIEPARCVRQANFPLLMADSVDFTLDKLCAPPSGYFTVAHIQWHSSASLWLEHHHEKPPPHLSRQGKVAFIPWSRVADFIAGEATRGSCSFIKSKFIDLSDAQVQQKLQKPRKDNVRTSGCALLCNTL